MNKQINKNFSTDTILPNDFKKQVDDHQTILQTIRQRFLFLPCMTIFGSFKARFFAKNYDL